MMANTTKAEVLDRLAHFKHGTRTNAAKKILTNHDACAFIIWSLGPTTKGELLEILMTWRFGKAEYREERSRVWDRNGNPTDKYVTRRIPKMGFDYLFNDSVWGGYGFIGTRHDARGNWMYATEFSTGKFQDQNSATTEPRCEGECVYFRRTYWYRVAPGVYGPTLECGKRMTEIPNLNLH